MLAIPDQEQRNWTIAGLVALAAHVGVASLVLVWSRPAMPPVPEPVVQVELPPAAALAPAAVAQQASEIPPKQAPSRQAESPPIDVPPVSAPQAKNPVVLPSPAPPEPVRAAAPGPAAASVNPVSVKPDGARSGASAVPGDDPSAKRVQANYFALVSAHLNRRKVYPSAARQARQQGVVTIRFTVDRNGDVSAVAIKRSSGHDLLDNATLELLQRVAPLPPMPASMQRDSVTLSLPIEYSLRTN